MDLQYPLLNDNELVVEIEKITHSASSSEPSSQLIALLKTLLKANQFPICHQCSTPLFNTVCIYISKQLYCSTCSEEISIESHFFDNQLPSYIIDSLNLGEKCQGLPTWSFGDLLQFSAIIENQNVNESQKNSGNLLDIGKYMLNKKDSFQVLQYLNFLNNKKKKRKASHLFEYISPTSAFLDQNINISFESLKQLTQKQSSENFFEKFKQYENPTLNMIKNILANTKNQKHIDLLNKMRINEIEQNLNIYQQLIKSNKIYSVKRILPSPDSIKSHQGTQDLTNEDVKSSWTEIPQELKDKKTKEDEIMNLWATLMPKINKLKPSKGIKKNRPRSYPSRLTYNV